MKISYRWLQEWVKLDIPPEELADRLSMSGLEVEEIQSIVDDGADDLILDVAVTPNRGDCLSVLGIAREVAHITDSTLPPLPHIELAEAAPPGIGEYVSLRVEEVEGCPRYTARLLRNVRIGPSPEWLKQRLAASGLRSINNVVDATNYVLLEWGQPLHAFDFDQLKGGIVVRRATQGETLTTLDGAERSLDQNMLVIADHTRVVALAGVMGGGLTEVTPKTQNVLLECAYFNPSIIRGTSRRLGLSTESSYRFERGVDIAALPQALNRASQLIQQLAGGDIIQGMLDEYPHPISPAEVDLRFGRVNRILGTSLSAAQIIQLIKSSGLIILDKQARGVKLRVPSYRADITREIDVIEEIARLYGYQKIPMTTPKGCIANNPVNQLPRLEGQIRDTLVNCGFGEAINFSFTNEKICCRLNMRGEAVRLKNPLSHEQQLLRTSLIPSLLENLSTNAKRQQGDVCLFELSTVYQLAAGGELPTEKRLIAGVMMGKRQPPFWDGCSAEIDFYDVKGVVATLLAGLGIRDVSFYPHQLPFLQSAAQVRVAKDTLGVLGKLKAGITTELDLETAVYAFELDFTPMLKYLPVMRRFEPLCSYPAIIRDVGLVIREGISAQQVEDIIAKSHQPYLRRVRLFDVYRGAPLSEEHKSLGFSLCYQSNDRTLTEEEVNSSCAQLIEELKRELGVTLRE